MKTLTIKILILTTALLLVCKKTTTNNPVPPTPLQPNGQDTMDTTKVGMYQMVTCDKPGELSTGVFITLRYKTYHYYSTDTTDKIILYWMPNNVNTAPGNLKISQNVIYDNESTNNSQPYIEEHTNDILGGFNDCSGVKLNAGGIFNGDTMILNFHVSPLTGSQYDMKAKYKKI